MRLVAIQDLLMAIFRSALNWTELDSAVKEQLTSEAVNQLYDLAKRNDLAHILSATFRENKVSLDGELTQKLEKEEFLSIYRLQHLNYAYAQICQTFDEAKIDYIPLKGSVIRPYYPMESMRTSCDIDILVRESDLDAAMTSLMKKGYRCEGGRNFHDVSLFSPNNIHLELHFNIMEATDNLDEVLKDAWKYAMPLQGSKHEFTKDFFLFHIFAHASYHFLGGGCGIRTLMDVWIINHKMKIRYIDAEQLLKSAGIYKFAEELTALSEVCFSGRKQEDYSDMLLSYIVNGGVYGTSKNRLAARKRKTKSTFSYTASHIFMPYKNMVQIFPILRKAPVLLPFCWIIRLFRGLRKKGKLRSSLAEIQTFESLTEDEIERVEIIKQKLDL